ncbi:MAG: nickel pincer cofactor-dependent isomerase, group 22, partial [Limisphaerales bacterium]
LGQRFAPQVPIDVESAIAPGLASLASGLRPGSRVGVAVGSRGIAGLKPLVSVVIDTLRRSGALPFILPAMGSHGGATADGQLALLAEYGVTEAAMGVPFRAGMEVEVVGRTDDGHEVVCSVEALRADSVVLINRIKPHTDFRGELGSGLLKMSVVGLGKAVGAAAFHRAASRWGYERVLRAAARLLRQRLPVLAGVAIVENQRHETARIEVVPGGEIEAREGGLCAEAARLMPRLPFEELDLLIVDRMGKNISGTGMDPAVIGRMIHGYSLAEDQERRSPHVRRLFVRDLTPESHGNAIGIGMADFTTRRLVEAMDRRVTVTNSLTALSLQGAKIPIYFDSDREALSAAIDTLALPDPTRARVVRIADTLSVER